MFLFTDRAPSAPQTSATDSVPHAGPLRQASKATGISFDYLAKTAERESRFNPNAKAPTSSATGMFQFLEQTWLGMVKQEGAKLGLGNEASAITSEGGRFTVADGTMRQKILALRQDPGVSAMMAGAFAAKNGQQLEQALGRKPKEGELYIAHFLGASGAKDLIAMAQINPEAKAAGSFSDAASANHNVFFDRAGRARSVGEVYATLTNTFTDNPVPQTQPTAATTDKAYNMFRVKGEGKPMHGLFRSSGEAVAEPVSDVWSKMARQGRGEMSNDVTRIAFFPRESRMNGSAAPVSPIVGAASSRTLVNGKPIAGAAQMSQADAMEAVRRAKPNAATIGQPLDLMRFVKGRSGT